MKFVCAIGQEGVRILRCFGYDGHVEIPEEINGITVRELGAYVFADTLSRKEDGVNYLAQLRERADEHPVPLNGEMTQVWEWEECSKDLLDCEALEDGTPVIKTGELRSVVLPKGVKKIGTYGFYLCENLEKLTFYHGVVDLGAGLFTGCLGLRELEIWSEAGEKSCLKEVLAELRQTLRVKLYDEKGKMVARLIFPEYFEESVENTPARILIQEMHGCGHRYRNAFSGTELQYSVYDKLFVHLQVQESAALATELALGRLRFPFQLNDERRGIYEAYAAEHGGEIVEAAFSQIEEMAEILSFAGQAAWCTSECMEEMLAEAGRRKNPQASGILMELRRRQRKGRGERKSWLTL